MVLELDEICGADTEIENHPEDERAAGRPQLDPRPEFYQYKDEGCRCAQACLECPFSQCVYERRAPRKRKSSKQRRNNRIAKLFKKGRDIKELAELSESIPVPEKATMPTVEGSREIDISGLTNRIMIAAVEYPAGAAPPEYQQFSIWGETLTITSGNQPDGNNCNIYYGVPHMIDAQGSTLPDKYTDIVAGGACGYAAIELALYSINRVNSGGQTAPGDMLEWGNQKLKIFRQELKRLGRRNRIRVSGLTRAY